MHSEGSRFGFGLGAGSFGSLARRPPLALRPVAPKGKRRLEDFDYRGVTLDGGRMRCSWTRSATNTSASPTTTCSRVFASGPGCRRRARISAAGTAATCSTSSARSSPACRGCTPPPATRPAGKGQRAGGRMGQVHRARRLLLLLPQAERPALHLRQDRSAACSTPISIAATRRRCDHLSRITDWAIKNLDRSQALPDGSEWYTLSENLYRAYLVTGDEKYRDFAKVWEYPEYWDIYARKADLFGRASGKHTDAYHAYSHVNTLGGAGAAYLVTGEPATWRSSETPTITSRPTRCSPPAATGRTNNCCRATSCWPSGARPRPPSRPSAAPGRLQDGQVPPLLHRRRPVRRLGRTAGDQRPRREHPHDGRRPGVLLLQLQSVRRRERQSRRRLDLLHRHASRRWPIIAISSISRTATTST